MDFYGKDVKKVLVLYTGGTIGMIKNADGAYIPSRNTFIKKIKSYPEMHNEYLAKKVCNGNVPNDLCVISHATPKSTKAIAYLIKEYDPLLDSSNMTAAEWTRIAKDVEKYYLDYDGFVILHGTDTMAYTASALSFMLEGLSKTIVVTGAQIPIFEPRSDAKDNVQASLIFSSCYNIPEVCVCFANRLMRGNRTVKSSSNLLTAFSSPNYHNLGKVGIHFKVHEEYVSKHGKSSALTVHTNLNPNVGILQLYPTMTGNMLSAFLNFSNPPMEGVVLQTYGIGNLPSTNKCLIKVLREAVEKGVVVVNITQCMQGTVTAVYETGKKLEEIGIIQGHDMTAEAALAKLSYVLGIPGISSEERKEIMMANIRGELTV